MTRNNLGAHLTWLSRNSTLSKPVPISLPTPRDAGSLVDSLSQTELAGSDSQTRTGASLRPAPVLPNPASRVPSAPAANASVPDDDEFEDNFEDEEEALAAAEDDMARLNSASKSQRPSLVIKQPQQQLPTPASTSKPRSFGQAYADVIEQESM